MVQNHPKMTNFGPRMVQKWPQIRSKMAQKGSKGVKVGQKPFKSHLDLIKLLQNTRNPLRTLPDAPTYCTLSIGWNVDFDRFFRRSKFSILLKYLCNCQQEGVYLDLFWSVWPENSNRIKLVKNGGGVKMAKRSKKWSKGAKNGSTTFIKLLKNTQNPLRILPDTPTYCTLS